MVYAGNTNMLGSFSDPMVKEDMAPVLSIATPVELPFQYLFSRETVNRRDPQWGVDFITRPTTIWRPTLALRVVMPHSTAQSTSGSVSSTSARSRVAMST